MSEFGNWFREQQDESSTTSSSWKFWENTEGDSNDIESGQAAGENTPLFANIMGSSSSSSMFSRKERLQAFTFLIFLSVIFFAVAFFLGLPLIVITPGKFGLSFTIGSLLFMGGFTMLEGPMNWLKRTCSRERAVFTIIYIISMLLTLYACVIMKSYLLTVITSGIQIVALIYYALSELPGGARGLKFFSKMVVKAAMSAIGPCLSASSSICSCFIGR